MVADGNRKNKMTCESSASHLTYMEHPRKEVIGMTENNNRDIDPEELAEYIRLIHELGYAPSED